MRMYNATFILNLQFRVAILWQNKIDTKAARKMLVKSITGLSIAFFAKGWQKTGGDISIIDRPKN
jgi:hypothetical protein